MCGIDAQRALLILQRIQDQGETPPDCSYSAKSEEPKSVVFLKNVTRCKAPRLKHAASVD